MSLLGSDDNRNPAAPQGSDFGVPAQANTKYMLPVSERYDRIYALAVLDFDLRYWCSTCNQKFMVPTDLSLSASAFQRKLEKAFREHALCEVDANLFTALGELLG